MEKKTNAEKKEVQKGDNKRQVAENINSNRKNTKTNKYTKTKKNVAEKTMEQNVTIETTKTISESWSENNKKKPARKTKLLDQVKDAEWSIYH